MRKTIHAIALALVLSYYANCAPSAAHQVIKGDDPVAEIDAVYYAGNLSEAYIRMRPGKSYMHHLDMSVFGPFRPEMTPTEAAQTAKVHGAKSRIADGGTVLELNSSTGRAEFSCREYISHPHSTRIWELRAYPAQSSQAASWLPPSLVSLITQNTTGSFSWSNGDGTPGLEVIISGGNVQHILWLRSDERDLPIGLVPCNDKS